jgi:hypothetical protein
MVLSLVTVHGRGHKALHTGVGSSSWARTTAHHPDVGVGSSSCTSGWYPVLYCRKVLQGCAGARNLTHRHRVLELVAVALRDLQGIGVDVDAHHVGAAQHRRPNAQHALPAARPQRRSGGALMRQRLRRWQRWHASWSVPELGITSGALVSQVVYWCHTSW